MDLFQIDDDGRLFISQALEEWETVARSGIDVVIDLEGGLDSCIPTMTNHCLYVYFPIDDDNEQLPCLTKLRAIARLGAGLILVELGMPGPLAVERLRARRPGALYNEGFAEFLASLAPSGASV